MTVDIQVIDKARISCFGHGWACELPGKTHFVGSFPEAVQVFSECCAQVEIAAWISVFERTMGMVQTAGRA